MKQGEEMESNDELIWSNVEENINSIQIPFYPRAHSSDHYIYLYFGMGYWHITALKCRIELFCLCCKNTLWSCLITVVKSTKIVGGKSWEQDVLSPGIQLGTRSTKLQLGELMDDDTDTHACSPSHPGGIFISNPSFSGLQRSLTEPLGITQDAQELAGSGLNFALLPQSTKQSKA